MGVMSHKHAIKVAKKHRDNASGPGVRKYWVHVIKSIKVAREKTQEKSR